MEHPPIERTDGNRTRAVLAILPFVALGVADVLLLLFWGLDPLWGFMILPPILAISILGYIGFKHGFIRDVGDGREVDGGRDVDVDDRRGVGDGRDDDASTVTRRN